MPNYRDIPRNRDSFEMQAAAARLRAADPQLDPDVARVLAQQRYTERDNARLAAGGASYAPDDPRNALLLNPPVLGQRAPLPGGGFGPAGPIDVNSYAGSRYAAPPALVAAGPSAVTDAPNYAPGTVDSLLRDLGRDPATEGGIRQQMLAAELAQKGASLDATRAGTDHTRLNTLNLGDQMDERRTEAAAIGAAAGAIPPAGGSVGIARQIMAGGFTAGFAPGSATPALASIAQAGPPAEDPSDAYFRAGGRNPAMAALLRREVALPPRIVPLKTSNGSTVDVLQDRDGSTKFLPTRPILTPEEEGKKAGLVKDAELKATDASKLLGEVSDAAESSRVASGSLKRITDLYKQGATTGFGQPVLSTAASAIARITGKNVQIGTQQQLEKELNNLVMEHGKALIKGSGAVSNYERDLIAKSTANPSMTPQANLAILGVMQRINDRNVALDRKRIELDEAGKSGPEIASELRKLRDSMPVGVEAIGGSAAQNVLSKYGIKPKGTK